MKKKKSLYVATVLTVLTVLAFWSYTRDSQYQNVAEELFGKEVTVKDTTKRVLDDYIVENYPAVEKIFSVQEMGKKSSLGTLFIVVPEGYGGSMYLAVAIGHDQKKTLGVKVLAHSETKGYGDLVTEDWFINRLKGKPISAFLQVVKLDPDNVNDVVQITGASISSKSAVNGVNAAIGAYNYMESGNRMGFIPRETDKNIIMEETESFVITGEGERVKVTMEELMKLPRVRRDCILRKSTGTEIPLSVEGPTLQEVLKHYKMDITNYTAMGITARDGYYALVPSEILHQKEILLAYMFNDEPIDEEEKPIRVVIPEEFGVYWVKMVSNIDFYSNITQKDIHSIKVFDALTRDIKPYMYEYYGKKDASIEIGKILQKLGEVDTKGFFTMVSSDGLVKNETITMVKQRYYIKTEGENAPMNIGPDFKLGMNVKHMAYFTTTKDAVIFPREIEKITGTVKLGNHEGIPLAELLRVLEIKDNDKSRFELVSTLGDTVVVESDGLDACILKYEDNMINAIINYKGKETHLRDMLEINKLGV